MMKTSSLQLYNNNQTKGIKKQPTKADGLDEDDDQEVVAMTVSPAAHGSISWETRISEMGI